MIQRYLYKQLENWKNSLFRLPLILRGARQVGKTTLINEFGKSYDQYLYFNLEKKVDLRLFQDVLDMDKMIQLLFLSRGLENNLNLKTLIFIDEIQESPHVIELLRFFKEDYSYLDVIVTGSLLEFGLEKISKIPVGRVEFLDLHPLNFEEYLNGSGNEVANELIQKIPLEEGFSALLFNLFHEFVLIGGMPGLILAYLEEKDITRVRHLYSGLIESYKSDVEKYAINETHKRVIRHIMDTAPYEIDNRIKLNHFGSSSFKSREVKEALNSLEKARLLELIYPTTQTQPPLIPDFKKQPRLHFLDIGLINYQLGLHQEILTINDLHNSSRGKIVQQIVNQEIRSKEYLPGNKYAFWVREERGTSSEVDIIFSYKNMLIPIEVKAGASGRLRSLHEFMDRCPHDFAVRFYGGKVRVDDLKTRKGKKFRLLNLPYFLSCWLEKYLDWFIN